MDAPANPNNFINDGVRSTQEAYYEFMLRKEKLGAIVKRGADGEYADSDVMTKSEAEALNSIGDKEKLELKILARLYSLADSSAELLQVKALTDCKTREDAAKKMAEEYYRKLSIDEVINRFIDPEKTKDAFKKSKVSSRKIYGVWGGEAQ